MRPGLTICSLVLFLFMTGKLFSQNTACCDSVVTFPDTIAAYGKGAESFLKFSREELFPVLEDVYKETGITVGSLRTKLTIDCEGKVIAAEVLEKSLPQSYKDKLAGKFLAMSAWKPAYKNNKPVCSVFNFPLSCIRWE